MKQIKFGDIRIGEVAKNHIRQALISNVTSCGPKVARFEQEFSKLFGHKHTICVSSGTDALINAYLSLYEFGASKGDEVIVPALSFISTSTAVLAANLTPRFVDIKRETLNIDENLIEQNINSKTKAICAVSTMGKPPNVEYIRKLCDKYGLIFILDNAEGHSCKYHNKFMEDWADIVTYSFYVAHVLSCGSEGGAVCTNRDDIKDIILSTKTHGRRNGQLAFYHDRLGYNSKPSELNFCIGLEQLELFWDNFYKRKNNVKLMRDNLDNLRDIFIFSEEEENCINSPHAFSVVPRDDKFNMKDFCDYLTNNGIAWKMNFKSIPTEQKAFGFMGYKYGDFPEAEFAGNGVHWGCHQYLSEEDCYYITSAIKKYFS